MEWLTSMFPIPATPNPIWFAMEWGAYGISAILILWMVIDMIRTNTAYSEDVLQSSREGEIDP
jgi:heme exporter protein D